MEYDVNGTLWYGSNAPDDSDYCVKGCYWRVDGGTLIIGGRGTLVWAKEKYDHEYDYDYLTFPTSGYQKVIIEEEIESLAPCAFSGCRLLKKVIFKGTKEQWRHVKIRGYNFPLFNAKEEFSPQGGQESGIQQ